MDEDLKAKALTAAIIVLGKMAKADSTSTWHDRVQELQNVCLAALGEAPVSDLDDVIMQ